MSTRLQCTTYSKCTLIAGFTDIGNDMAIEMIFPFWELLNEWAIWLHVVFTLFHVCKRFLKKNNTESFKLFSVLLKPVMLQ